LLSCGKQLRYRTYPVYRGQVTTGNYRVQLIETGDEERVISDIMAVKSLKGRIVIDSSLCKGCYLCISVCPNECIVISDQSNEKGYHPAKFAEKKDGKNRACTGCALCALICPDIAIEVYRG